MRLHEAIEKAGEGMIKHSTTGMLLNKKILSVSLPAEIAMDDNWEVVEDEVIEVGDVVKSSGATLIHLERTVIWYNKSSVTAVVQFETDAPERVPRDSLTLISKGPKVHTFEGVEIYQREGNVLVVPKKANELDAFCNGTRQPCTMTLTEERVEP